MPRYDYQARGARGEPLQGAITAMSPQEAARLLRADGKFVVNLNATADDGGAKHLPAGAITVGGKRIKSDDVIFFASQMAVMVDTGVSITDALEGIIEQCASPAFKAVLEKVLADVQTGTPFSMALAKHPKAFKPLLVNLIKASEASGKLGAMLDRCAGYLSAQRAARKKITGALTYPAFLLFMAIAVVVVLLGVLMPRFTRIYAGKEQFLPKPTKILMAVSDALTSHWVLLLASTIVAVVGTVLFFRSTRGQRPAHWILLHIPLSGKMLHKAYLARSLRTLGTLIDSGVSMLDAVSITRAVVGNRYFQDMWDDVDVRVQRGEQLTAPLLDTPLVPRPITQMIRAGERSGHLGPVLDRVSTFLESDLDQAIKRVTQMIEPIMIFVMGGIIGSIVIALLMPIFTIGRVMGH